jgi:hypothetical protein
MFFGLYRITAPPPLRTLPQCRPVPHYQAVHDYAKAHGLEYAWEGTAAYGVFPRGPIIGQEYAVFVIEAVRVTDGEAVARHAAIAHSLIFRSCVLIPP